MAKDSLTHGRAWRGPRLASDDIMSVVAPCALFYALGVLSAFAFSRFHPPPATSPGILVQMASGNPVAIGAGQGFPASPLAALSDAILPILRDWGCGHGNMEIPRVLLRKLGGRPMEAVPIGRNRIVVDVGLGQDAAETLHAVSEGFVVFSFDSDISNVQQLKSTVEADPVLNARFHFVALAPGSAPDFSKMPPPRVDGAGFAYVYYAALDEKVGSGEMVGGGNVGQVRADTPGSVPFLSLDAALPPWVEDIFFFKIDTQGFELRVLKGAMRILEGNKARYILFEYSPMLMTNGGLGNHTELLRLLPGMGYLCFDMMGEHLALPRHSSPLSAYQGELLGWQHYAEGRPSTLTDNIGPWDDIMCANPAAMLADKAPTAA